MLATAPKPCCPRANSVAAELALRIEPAKRRGTIATPNAIAWVARAVTKLTAIDPGTVGFASWWAHSLVSYALCGALAGLVSAALLFQLGARQEKRA